MRYRRLLLAWPLAFFACLSSNNAPPGEDAGFDAGTPEGQDGAGPGADGPAPVDSPVTPVDGAEAASPIEEASVDAPADTTPAAITVVVGGPHGLESGVPIVWSNASGAVVATGVTGVGGAASTVAPDVTMMTAGLGDNLNPMLYTVTSLEAGQTLYVADISSIRVTSAPNQYTAQVASVPSTPVLGDGAAPGYQVMGGNCVVPGPQGGIPFSYSLTSANDQQPCMGLSLVGSTYSVSFPVLVEADDAVGNPLGYAFSKDDPIAPADDAGVLPVAMGNPWQTTFAPQELVGGPLPDGGAAPTFGYSEVADGVVTPLPGVTTALEDGAAGTVFYGHPGFPTTVLAEAHYATAPSGGIGDLIEATSAAAPTSAGTFSFDPTHALGAPVFDTATVGWGAAQPVVSWTLSSGSLSTSTSVVAIAEWYDSTLDGGGFQTGVWTIVTPGTSASSITPPVLPSSFAAYAPGPNANNSGTTMFAFYGGTAMPTYASFLPMASLMQSQSDTCFLQTPGLPAVAGIGSVWVSFFSAGAC